MKTKSTDTVESLITAGKYEYVSEYAKEIAATAVLTGDFPEFEMVQFAQDPSDEEVLAEFAKRGFERPTIEDALRYGATQWNGTDWVVFMHEPFRDSGRRLRVLYLSRWSGERGLRSDVMGGRWVRRCLFPGRRPRKFSELDSSAQSSDSLPLVLEINGVTYKRV